MERDMSNAHLQMLKQLEELLFDLKRGNVTFLGNQVDIRRYDSKTGATIRVGFSITEKEQQK